MFDALTSFGIALASFTLAFFALMRLKDKRLWHLGYGAYSIFSKLAWPTAAAGLFLEQRALLGWQNLLNMPMFVHSVGVPFFARPWFHEKQTTGERNALFGEWLLLLLIFGTFVPEEGVRRLCYGLWLVTCFHLTFRA